MLKNFIKGIKEALPAVGGIIGYSVAGPLGAGIGSGIGSLAAGKEADVALQNALIGGALGYGGQTYFGRNPTSNPLGLGSFFRQGTIPGVSNYITPFGEREAGSTLSKMAGFTAPKQVSKEEFNLTQTILDKKKEFMDKGFSEDEAFSLAQSEASKMADSASKFDISDFFSNNMGYIVPGLALAQQAGLFDEKTETLDLPKIEIGSQGSLPTGLASLVAPTRNTDGTYTYNVKEGGIMHAKEGEQMKTTNPPSEYDDLIDLLKNPKRFIQPGPGNPRLYERDNKFKLLEMMGMVGRAAEGKQMFSENSPRRDLFLDRNGPISDDRGSPNKDTVYAKLADGEFVVNADTVADIGYGMGADSLEDAKEMGGSFFYGLQDAQKKGILANNIKGMA